MQSQLRKHLRYKWIHRLRSTYNKWRGVRLGRRVFIDKNVELLRFPGNISIDDNVVVKEGARICACNEKALIRIGKNTTVGYHTFIFASADIRIGDNCLIAPFVYIVDSNHQTSKGILINQQPNVAEPIKIGNDVWIASNVTILKGVTISNGAVIAANSVVNTDVGPNEIFGGTPAKKISERT
jgi:acetyltransferase-like isoleucine patch superfamily enzyme